MLKRIVSESMLVLLLTTMLMLAFNIKPVKSDWTWTETVYIRADGSVDPDTAPISTVDNITYTLTDNIVGDVPKDSSAIVAERSNIIIDGNGYTLQGTKALYSKGVDLTDRSNVTIKNMEIESFQWGIMSFDSLHACIISGNNITANVYGIYLWGSSDNIISGNNITNNIHAGIGFGLSSNNSISGNNINNSTIGIELLYSSNNSISGNNITQNFNHGISLSESSNNIISGNDIAYNTYDGILLIDSSNSNVLFGNNIISNQHSIRLYNSSNNNFYHNNFIDNIQQIYDFSWDDPEDPPSINIWDDGYLSGGNYWSDYTGKDRDGDDIGGTPYVIDENNQDNYPLMSPWSPKTPVEVPFWMQWWLWAIVAVGIVALAGAVYFLKKRKPSTTPLPLESTEQSG